MSDSPDIKPILITRPQVMGLMAVIMELPTTTTLELVDTDNYGNIVIEARNEMGVGQYRLLKDGGRESLTPAPKSPPTEDAEELNVLR